MRRDIIHHLARNGTDEEFDETGLAEPIPTGYPPGSVEKIEVMRRRVASGQWLFHPFDAFGSGPTLQGSGKGKISGIRCYGAHDNLGESVFVPLESPYE